MYLAISVSTLYVYSSEVYGFDIDCSMFNVRATANRIAPNGCWFGAWRQ